MLALALLPVAAVAQAQLHLLIPGGAGGGWDRTARAVGQALSASGLAEVRYENLSGGGGGKAIAHLIELDDPNMWMVNSTPIVVRSLQKVFPQSYRDLTPLASMIGDYSVIAVRAESEIVDLADFAARQRANPRRVIIAGGSVAGGTDHIVAALLVKGVGNDPATTKYIPYDAGGKAMAGLLSGEVQLLSSGFGEVVDMFEQGWVRLLCVAAPTRLARAPAVPTCAEAGAPEVVFVNWRGFFAAPGLDAASAARYRQLLNEVRATDAWQEIKTRNGWVDLYRAGPDFVTMLNRQEDQVGTLMRELGLL